MTSTPDEPSTPRYPALFTDLYELAMLQAYVHEGMFAPAVFELSVRALPRERRYLLACGLGDVLAYLEALTFTEADIAYLATLDRFEPDFLEWLRSFRFSGDVRAMPEGTPCFGGEPLIEVRAPLPEAQLVETFIINQAHLQTLVGSKGVRAVRAAEGRRVIDFGARRAHGLDAALKASRALWIAGFDGTSNVAAAREYGIPVTGTMAHSYVQAHENEIEAFRAFVRQYPDTVLLVDTYDTRAGVDAVVRVARELESRGEPFRVRALRIDSGDLAQQAFEARAQLDAAGLQRVELLASGGLDEHSVAALVRAGAPYDGFGVGTRIDTSADAPSLDMVYKLVQYDGRGTLKLSPGKRTLPGAKQVYRRFDGDGRAERDVVALEHERGVEGEPLLVEVMLGGCRTEAGRSTLLDARERARRELSRLPEALLELEPGESPYPVEVSPGLEAERARLAARARGAGRA